MDNSLNLTRLLYCKDEVELMIVYRLLQKQCLNEVLFWIAEYYYSGYTQEAWNLVFKCYYDFYAALNPTIECSLFKKYIRWKKASTIEYLLDVVYTLWKSNRNCDAFLLRMRLQQQIHANAMKEKKFSGRPPSWKKTFDASQQSIALSLHKQHIPNILYFIHTRDMDTLYQVFIQYFSTIGKMKSRIYLLKKHWDSLQEYDMEHLKPSILLALYASMQLDAESVRTRRIIFGHDVRHTEYISGIMKHDGSLWEFLRNARKYGVDSIIGAFDLARFHHGDLKPLIWYHWEYYAYETPIWHERFITFNGVQNEEEKDVDFPQDEHEGDFHEKYGYEPDEQNLETQLKCTKHIERLSLNDWIVSLFQQATHSFVGTFKY